MKWLNSYKHETNIYQLPLLICNNNLCQEMDAILKWFQVRNICSLTSTMFVSLHRSHANHFYSLPTAYLIKLTFWFLMAVTNDSENQQHMKMVRPDSKSVLRTHTSKCLPVSVNQGRWINFIHFQAVTSSLWLFKLFCPAFSLICNVVLSCNVRKTNITKFDICNA